MDPELKKVLDAINGYADKNGIFTAIKDDPALKAALYQPAYNDGHGAATDAHKGSKTTLENRITAAENAKKAAEDALAAFKAENPDKAALHTQYTQKITDLETQIANLKATHAAEKREAKRDGLKSAYKAELIALKVDPDKAAAMADADVGLLTVDESHTPRVLQPGTSIAFAGDEKAQLKSLAALRFKDVPKKLILSDVPGGGSNDGESAGGGTGDDKRAKFQKIREQALKDHGRQPATAGGGAPAAPLMPDPMTEVNRRMGRTQRA
jgi:hypothetical protein